ETNKRTGRRTGGYKARGAAGGAKTEQFSGAGQNPRDGVVIHYWLAARPADGVVLTILDGQGNEIRSYSTKREKGAAPGEAEAETQAEAEAVGEPEAPASPGEPRTAPAREEGATGAEPPEEDGPWAPAAPGMNRFVWDGRHAKPTKLQKPRAKSSREEALEGSVPPRAIPGSYQVRLQVGSDTFTESFTFVLD